MKIRKLRYDLNVTESKYEKSTSWNIAIGSFVTTVIVWAYFTNDPVNTPKLAIISLTAFVSLGFMLTQIILKKKSFLSWPFLSVVVFFLLWSLISIIISDTKFLDGIFGTWGRNTGWLAYLCFVLIFIASTSIKNSSAIRRVLTGLYFAGIVNAVYFVLTLVGVQLIPWNNTYNRILGTFGNPNFLGAFMGFFGVLLFSRLLSREITFKQKLIDLLLLLVAIYEIKLSLASQGVVVLFGGISLQLFIWIKVNRSKMLLILYSIVVGIFSSLALAGALNMGPLSSFVYKPSVTFRGQYWQAAWNAGVDHPVFGVGFDSLGFWYGRYRTPGSIIFPGPETTTNAAHNVYLDILASGGFPLFIAYVLLNLMVLVKATKLIMEMKSFSWVPVALVSVWVCYQTQSLISINQIGIAIWGWVLSGLILAYPISKHNESDLDESPRSQGTSKGRNVILREKSFTLSLGLILGLVGFAIGFQPMRADMNWNRALRPINPTLLETQAKAWPLSYMRLMHASSIYTANGKPDMGLELAKVAAKEFPDVWMVWDIMLKNPNLNSIEREEVLSQLRRIDPLNPNYKK
jgi:O-antigen ligase